MGRLHGRNGTLFLKDRYGQETVIPLTGWAVEYRAGDPDGPRIEAQMAPDDPGDPRMYRQRKVRRAESASAD